MKKILVTGGAGYIGNFVVKRLLDDGLDVVVLDNLERGHKNFLDKRSRLLKKSLSEKNFLLELFAKEQFDGVIHLAGYISMAESVENPALYFENNVQNALNLIEATRISNTKNFIFSSTAGVYGNPDSIPIQENHKKNPTNPYGESKLMVERILAWYRTLFGFNYVALRYFNAAGAALDGSMGEAHNPETHIIPNAMNALITDQEFMLYGDDYDTPDGTCIRDYIHVIDLVDAHVLALNKLEKEPGGFIYNVGTGKGYSNREVLDMIEKVSWKKIKTKISQRRPGDASQLIADPSRIKKELHFEQKYSDLSTIVESAWKWHSKQST